MENVQGRSKNGSNGTFLKKKSENEKLSGSYCGNAAIIVTGLGTATDCVRAQDDCNCFGSGGGDGCDTSWLTCGQQHIHNNNNNNNSTESNVQVKCCVGMATTTTTISTTTNVARVALAKATTDASCTGVNSSSGVGGNDSDENKSADECSVDVRMAESVRNAPTGATTKTNGPENQKQNGSNIAGTDALTQNVIALADKTTASDVDVFAEAAGVVSRSTSLNNSIENLSYTSDNYYADDLLLLEGDDEVDDVDVEAEEISLNSDDCVYAYRGDGTDFDLALDAIAGHGHGTGNNCMVDDETDFLEMDFEPDPLSEVEYGSVEAAPSHSDAFLMQRDACHLSGRHSATLGHYGNSAAATQRQLFSSPIDDSLPPQPAKTLQSQLLLSKNFARITMHLDQIKGENGDCDVYERTHSDRVSALGMTDDAVDAVTTDITTTAHSLPNALLSNFGRNMLLTKEECKISPSKVTGAKPKRLSTFSTSSSTSSKNSSKSRNSLRSTYALTALCNSTSFDERSASCTEFRCVPPKSGTSTEDCMRAEAATATSAATVAKDVDDFSANDEACLDCLEKEFLANTIGKAIDPNECPRCRKHCSRSIALFKRANQTPGAARCRSGSPLLFRDARDQCIFETPVGDYLNPRSVEWTPSAFRDAQMFKDELREGTSVSCDDNVQCADTKLKPRVRTRIRARTCDAEILQQFKSNEESMSQRRTAGDSFDSEHLLKNVLLTEKEAVTVSTLNLSEELLLQALDNLHVSYNIELIKSHFKLYYASNVAITTTTMPKMLGMHKSLNEFKDLKHLLMHESKKHCNHHKLKRLIELATRQQVEVQFQRNLKDTATALVPVKVADILQQWVRTKNLDVLKHLDKRFVEANVLGKIANIIRQAQQRCTPRRPLPECILVPQYHAAGILRLTKKS